MRYSGIRNFRVPETEEDTRPEPEMSDTRPALMSRYVDPRINYSSFNRDELIKNETDFSPNMLNISLNYRIRFVITSLQNFTVNVYGITVDYTYRHSLSVIFEFK